MDVRDLPLRCRKKEARYVSPPAFHNHAIHVRRNYVKARWAANSLPPGPLIKTPNKS